MRISDREHHIKVLEQFLHDYQQWGEDLDLEKTINYAISSLKTDLKYDLMYEGKEVYTKDDFVAMLAELQLEIEELEKPRCHNASHADGCVSKWKVEGVIQQKINKLKENENGNK